MKMLNRSQRRGEDIALELVVKSWSRKACRKTTPEGPRIICDLAESKLFFVEVRITPEADVILLFNLPSP